MSSTNKTTYYELPQFVDSDLFNPLVDDNDAYDKIDTALHDIAELEANDASEIVNVKNRITTSEGKIETLKTQNGDEALSTTAQTLSGAINELDGDIASIDSRVNIVEDDINNVNTGLKAKIVDLTTRMVSAESDIDTLEAQNGNDTLTTTAQTLSGAVNELNTYVKNFSVGISVKGFDAKGDGLTDDSVAIRTAIAYCNENGYKLYFPKGTYLYSFTEPVLIECDIDFGNSTIKFSNINQTGVAFKVGVLADTITVDKANISANKIEDVRLVDKTFALHTPISLGLRDGDGEEVIYKQAIILDENKNIANGYIAPTLVDGTYTAYNPRDFREQGITIENGKFEYLNNDASHTLTIFMCYKNNTRFSNLTFVYPNKANRAYLGAPLFLVTCFNCVVENIRAINPYGTASSGYILELSNCYNTTVKNFIALNKNNKSWGSIGTSFSDATHYKNCVTQRLDTHHAGTYDAENCVLNYANFAGGNGNITFKNCKFIYNPIFGNAQPIIGFRTDLMYLLNGRITVEDCIFHNTTSEAATILTILMSRETQVSPSAIGFKNLNILLKNITMYKSPNINSNMSLNHFSFVNNTYAKGINFEANNIDLNTSSFNVGDSDSAGVLNSYKLVNVRSNRTADSYLMQCGKAKFVELRHCEFVGKLVDSIEHDSVISFIDNVLNELSIRTTNTFRVIDNIITSDTALHLVGGVSPSYSVKKGNVIIDATNTNIGTWNS